MHHQFSSSPACASVWCPPSFITTAERSGIDWRGEVAALNAVLPVGSIQRERALAAVTTHDLTYPPYYIKSFHAYPEGNLGWLPAFEVRSATLSVCKRLYDHLPARVAHDRTRAMFFRFIMNHAPQGWYLKPQLDIADVGCGIGLSARDVASRIMSLRGKELPLLRMKAVDPSPYFLAVAKIFQAEADAMEASTPKGLC
ncbi:hypothetical protein BWQ96_05269 [Gracilariopsis chorda]|uniref:Uncharacterized protein n=1 Tax=Gracilariopsis chorda TaxID=448386 RepID=A0A2V3IS97_9FLOR|nr:hypothetical protein BWQ96_05269 [Gracilariopsis chorda]|eukprot:PXF44969.1 hypothetical protein BWQ96_05269 [Gracilariopsis chorda]